MSKSWIFSLAALPLLYSVPSTGSRKKASWGLTCEAFVGVSSHLQLIPLDFLRSQHDPSKTCSSKCFSWVSSSSHSGVSKSKMTIQVFSFFAFFTGDCMVLIFGRYLSDNLLSQNQRCIQTVLDLPCLFSIYILHIWTGALILIS